MEMNWAAKLYAVLARRRALLVAAVAVGLGCSYLAAGFLKLDKSLKALMPDSSVSLRQSVELLDLAPFSRVMLVQLTAEEPEAIPHLARAADHLAGGLDPALARQVETAEMPDLKRIMALLPALCDGGCLGRLREALNQPNMDKALAALKTDLAGPGGLQDLFWRLDPLALRGEVFSKFPKHQGWPLTDPLIGYPVSPDGSHLLIIIKPLVSMNDTNGAAALMSNLDRLTGELPRGISAQVAGAQRHTAANAAAIERDLTLTMGLALLLILGIYLFLVRSWGAVWLFLTPMVAVLVAAAGLTLAWPLVSGLALGFGAAVLGIAEDYAVHVHYALRRAGSRQEALNHVARPLLMSTILCVAGFGVLLFSSIPAIRQLAFFSGLAIVVGYLWAIVVLPHCPGMNRPREAPAVVSAPSGPKGRVKGVWPVFLGLAGLSVLLMSLLPVEISVRAMGLASRAIVDDQRSVEEIWRLEGGRRVYLVSRPRSINNTSPDAMELSGRLAEALNKQVPGSASSLAGLLPPVDAHRANLEGWRAFMAAEGREVQGKLAEAGQAAGFAPEAFAPFFDWFSAEGRLITPDELTRAGLGPLVENFMADTPQKDRLGVVVAEPDAPEPPADFDGLIFQISAAGLERGLSQAMAGEKQLLPYCVLICLGLLVWAFRDLARAALAFIPALGGLAAVLLVQLILGRPLGLVEAAAMPLVICLGADYGIVVVSELTDNADLGAPRAIFVSGLSTIAGIGILILASHPVLHALGRTVFIGLAAAMPISILLLPKMYSRQRGSHESNSTSGPDRRLSDRPVPDGGLFAPNADPR